MPRIDAPTLAEHRARQERALLDAAKELVAEEQAAPSLAQVGERAGLARSSVYQYFSSLEDLLQKVMEDVLPGWVRRVNDRVAAVEAAGERVWAYIEANVALFTGPEQASATTLAQALEPTVLQGPMESFHQDLQVPLVEALLEMGEPQVAEMSDLLNVMTVRACQPVRRASRRRRPTRVWRCCVACWVATCSCREVRVTLSRCPKRRTRHGEEDPVGAVGFPLAIRCGTCPMDTLLPSASRTALEWMESHAACVEAEGVLVG